MSFNITELIENVKGWSVAKELADADSIKQMQKLNEEWGELNAGKATGDTAKLYDSIGDVFVVLIILSQQMKFEKIERLIDPTVNGFGYYPKNEVTTDLLLLYGVKEIGMIANRMIDLIHNPGIINTRTAIQFHIRNLTSILYKVAINEDTDIKYCLQLAWDEIKNRQGKMIDGVFVKDEDIKEVDDDE
ncbi:phosphoribosyl-ATP diphosphatase [Streptococcus agalactiae]|uniref:phosphoribosyl-ATP diphosphatase n=1 Tax=Streptococcus agalactiae TaxID=1311 RepID=UPI00137522D4|nr:phosphoribosyl-ATP diphosphatase [Streptococcus agalactiae]KAF1125759.1 phosphoribosyl-ATP diphosphatase [Streptococcus agalactiae]MCD0021653.1 phosphoribosyl-ATP diphosphatase [Streptococcus agalactiae]HEN7824083.1 phosphoribosyl-ATP diphosphatase [Streptococcus agalactiae]HEN9347525.1 phosphoribosyl-ATP diphosphatase [Streptococcus agalactiae]HEO2002323.1 phosphoribosyl-ATP diphosphatase [Streptococcus agalactiae]